jgi:hypothetical protein
MEAFARRDDCSGILRGPAIWVRGVRSVLVEIAARLLERVAGYLLTAPNMMWRADGTQSEKIKKGYLECMKQTRRGFFCVRLNEEGELTQDKDVRLSSARNFAIHFFDGVRAQSTR